MQSSDAPIDRSKIDDAVRCLHDRLPLRERQHRLDASLRSVHRAILRSFADHGRPPISDAIARLLPDGNAAAALSRLGSDGLVVLDPDGREVIGAYPMTMDATQHEISIGDTDGRRVHAMCALDALSVSPMFGVEVTIRSRCGVTGDPILVRQRDREIMAVEPSTDVRVGVHWQRTGGVAAHSL